MSFQNNISTLQFLNAANIADTCNYILKEWKKNNFYIVHFMYYASLELIRSDIKYAEALKKSNIILVDGIGMQMYFKLANNKQMSNLNGTDLSPIMIELLHKQNIPITFYGTTKEQIQGCNEKLNEQYKTQVLHYFQDGYTALNWEHIPDNSALFIGMGTPLQEEWVNKHFETIQTKNLLVITVGGYFDFLSGFYTRAPKLIRSIKLEWLWRTILHPARHYKKRLRDTTIIFRPWLDRIKQYPKYFNILDI
jgi:exopolysaccharide biosynthesis WecB/TagA/CpsF family protein